MQATQEPGLNLSYLVPHFCYLANSKTSETPCELEMAHVWMAQATSYLSPLGCPQRGLGLNRTLCKWVGKPHGGHS